jgi:glc operon protein GlcG
MITIRVIPAALSLVLAAASSHAQVVNKPSLSLEGARQVITAAKREAVARNAPGGVIAVVDDGGNLIAVERLDGTFAAGASISIGKARTAALFKRPTRVFEELINKGRTAMTALTDFTPLQGGVPILQDGIIIGAVGVSGAASAQQDEELALAGAMALQTAVNSTQAGAEMAEATVLGNTSVTAAFAQGMPLLENGSYKIHASRRDKDGQSEIHTRDTDIVYVLEGSATLTTGGTMVNGSTTGQGELRGETIRGGVSRTLVKGDVVVVPAGVPHQFTGVNGPFLYYVVKVTDMRSGS